jgi:hypothetical protein
VRIARDEEREIQVRILATLVPSAAAEHPDALDGRAAEPVQTVCDEGNQQLPLAGCKGSACRANGRVEKA